VNLATARLHLQAGAQLPNITELLQQQRAAAQQAAGGTGAARPALDAGSGPARSSKMEGLGRPLAADGELWSSVQGRAAAAIACNTEGQQHAAGWQAEAQGGWANCELWEHSSATCWSGQQLTSSSYGRSRTRDGRHMLTYYQEGEQQKPYVATIRTFVRVVHPQLGTQRLAITDMYAHRPPISDDTTGITVFEFDAAAQHAFIGYPVLLHMVHRPCMVARRLVDGRSKVVFIPFAFRSGT
jgi:hypothetical protein